MAAGNTALDTVLQPGQYHLVIDGVDAAIVLGRDGLLIDGASEGALDPDGLAAHVPPMVAAAIDMGLAAGRGEFTLMVLEYNGGTAVVIGGAQLRDGGSAAGRVYNTCVHLLPDGSIGALYRKIHLFDVHFPAAGTSLCESGTVEPGSIEQAVIADMLQAPQTLGDEASQLSKDFDRGNMRFDSRDKVVAQIKLLTPQKLADFFHQTVVDPQGMAILSQVSGSQNGKAEYAHPQDGKVWENVSALQKSLPLMRENE